jgi:hypothetical protein
LGLSTIAVQPLPSATRVTVSTRPFRYAATRPGRTCAPTARHRDREPRPRACRGQLTTHPCPQRKPAVRAVGAGGVGELADDLQALAEAGRRRYAGRHLALVDDVDPCMVDRSGGPCFIDPPAAPQARRQRPGRCPGRPARRTPGPCAECRRPTRLIRLRRSGRAHSHLAGPGIECPVARAPTRRRYPGRCHARAR